MENDTGVRDARCVEHRSASPPLHGRLDLPPPQLTRVAATGEELVQGAGQGDLPARDGQQPGIGAARAPEARQRDEGRLERLGVMSSASAGLPTWWRA